MAPEQLTLLKHWQNQVRDIFTKEEKSYTIKQSKNHRNKLEQLSECKFLFFILDCKLTWSSHIQRIRNKIAKSEDIICQAKKFFRMKHLLHFIRHLFNTSYILHKILSKCKEAKKNFIMSRGFTKVLSQIIFWN